MKKLLLILLLSCASLKANAEPIKFHGIDVTMSTVDITASLIAKGYECYIQNKDYHAYDEFRFECARPPAEPPLSDKFIGLVGDGVSRWDRETIKFDCDTFNACNYPTADLIDQIEKRYRKKFTDSALQHAPQIKTKEIIGDDGDKLIFFPSDHGIWLQQWQMKKLDF
jgi:hypothetical protein